MKSLKYPAGNFVEIENLKGGRTVVLVCRDQVTFVDSSSVDQATPTIFHPVLKPELLGTLVSFCAAQGISGSIGEVIQYFDRRMNKSLEKDPLLLMRIMWFISKKAKADPINYKVSQDDIEWAIQQANAQETDALQIHAYADQFSQLSVNG